MGFGMGYSVCKQVRHQGITLVSFSVAVIKHFNQIKKKWGGKSLFHPVGYSSSSRETKAGIQG